MTRLLRAAQFWPLLVLAARNRQTLTYKTVSKLTGLKTPGIGQALFPIQHYCEAKGLPKLTALVVKEKTGMPGAGLRLRSSELPHVLQEVFSHDWLKHRAPNEEQLKDFDKPRKRR